MSVQWAAPDYLDGNWTVAKACGVPVFRSPIPATTAEYVFDQPWMALRTVAAATALGTAHPSAGLTPDYSTWYCVAEGQKEDIGNGIVRWMRTYAQVPATHDEWESYAYNFPGMAPIGPLSSTQVGRLPLTNRVTCRVQHDYFLVGAGQTYTTAGAIPVNLAMLFCAQDTISAVNYGGMWSSQAYLYDGPSILASNVGSLWKTTPTQTEYAAMMAAAATNGWSTGISYQTFTSDTPPRINTSTSVYSGGQFVAENSTLQRWMGPIYLRQTRYVLAG